jgi:hypothetical protein
MKKFKTITSEEFRKKLYDMRCKQMSFEYYTCNYTKNKKGEFTSFDYEDGSNEMIDSIELFNKVASNDLSVIYDKNKEKRLLFIIVKHYDRDSDEKYIFQDYT